MATFWAFRIQIYRMEKRTWLFSIRPRCNYVLNTLKWTKFVFAEDSSRDDGFFSTILFDIPADILFKGQKK